MSSILTASFRCRGFYTSQYSIRFAHSSRKSPPACSWLAWYWVISKDEFLISYIFNLQVLKSYQIAPGLTVTIGTQTKVTHATDQLDIMTIHHDTPARYFGAGRPFAMVSF